MNWNWFPINAGSAIQGIMKRRMLLDSCRINRDERARITLKKCRAEDAGRTVERVTIPT